MYDFLQVVFNRDHSYCLVFEKIALFAFWRQTDRQSNGQTDGHHRCVKPQSPYRELRLNNAVVDDVSDYKRNVSNE